MKAFLILSFCLLVCSTGYSQEATASVVRVDLLFIAKTILSAVIVFVGISALRSFMRHEEKS